MTVEGAEPLRAGPHDAVTAGEPLGGGLLHHRVLEELTEAERLFQKSMNSSSGLADSP